MSLEAQSRTITLTTQDIVSTTGRFNLKLSRISTLPVYALSLRTMVFKNMFYNVVGDGTSRTNNSFFFTLNGLLQEIIIDEGNYSITQLIQAVREKLEVILSSSGIVPPPVISDFSFNSINAKVSLTIDGGGVATPFELTGGSFTQSINKILGNTVDVVLDTLTPTAYQFNTTYNLSGESVVNVISSHMANNNGFVSNVGDKFINGRVSNVVAMVPVNQSFGKFIEYRSQDIDAEAIAYNIPIDMSSVDIYLADQLGRPLPLQNTALDMELIAWVR